MTNFRAMIDQLSPAERNMAQESINEHLHKLYYKKRVLKDLEENENVDKRCKETARRQRGRI